MYVITSTGRTLSPSLPDAQTTQSRYSETTWKTHAYVVLGYVLLSAGIALGITSFYISTVMHPLLAFATPAPFLAIGSLILNQLKQKDDEPSAATKIIKTHIPPAVRGIENEGSNDCWINASMQLLFHIQSTAGPLCKAGENQGEDHRLAPLIHALESYSSGKKVSSSTIRKWLKREKVSSADYSQQDDPVPFFNYVFQQLDYRLPTQRVTTIEKSGKSSKPLDDMCVSFLSSVKPSTSVAQAIEGCFRYVDENSGSTLLNRFESPPEDFFISIGQAAPSEKVETRTKPSFEVTLDASKVGEEATYACDGFLCHLGNRVDSGHWIAVLKKGSSWWHISDHLVSQISKDEAAEKMETAGWLHYTRTSQEP